jgi:hypothetical protein
MKKIFILFIPLIFLSIDVSSEENEVLIYKHAKCSDNYTVIVRGTEKEFKDHSWYDYRIFQNGYMIDDFFKNEEMCPVKYQAKNKTDTLVQVFCDGADNEATSIWSYRSGFKLLQNINKFFSNTDLLKNFDNQSMTEEENNSIGFYSCSELLDGRGG